jgi:hypothetical protein
MSLAPALEASVRIGHNPDNKTRLTECRCRVHSGRQPRRPNSIGAPIHRRSPAAPRPMRVLCPTGILNDRVVPIVTWSDGMGDRKYLTAEEGSDRYRGAVSVGTSRNWRAMRVGPAFVKIGKAVLYPVDEFDAWDKRNMVSCRASAR